MLKWCANPALLRGRPVSADIARVTDGIAASLREFHVSALRADEESGRNRPRPSSTRGQRSAAANNEIQSFGRSNQGVRREGETSAPRGPTRPRGIDLRALGATPNPKTNADGSNRDGSRSPNFKFAKRGGGGGAGAGGANTRGGVRGGRGAAGKPGGGRGGQRGSAPRRGGGNKKPGQNRRRDTDQEFRKTKEEDEPISERQRLYYAEKKAAEWRDRLPKPAKLRHNTPDALRESLGNHALPLITRSGFGAAGAVEQKLRLLAARRPDEVIIPEELARRQVKGSYVFFESDAEKNAAAAEAERLSERHATKKTEEKGELVKKEDVSLATRNAESRKEIVDSLVRGVYPPVKKGDVLKETAFERVSRLTWKNGTCSPQQGADILAKVKRIVPAQQSKPGKPGKQHARA
ncbi:hypothetical protein L228DRAFT_242550 [Xylona heveae TC161]|uniref:Uncharacterized protein n=1 Tax=Xylona heveae (strain CBS 132557 / TC161) TaxID=1328760 RepID=A0A165JEH3_XYLHT|nr:hypothetical protein L228DRAFT_242550 [Xylona heveae TC161]KZF26133.1 hypothetical protein L228DRAFT_242550 [Xylona heveae TC161]